PGAAGLGHGRPRGGRRGVLVAAQRALTRRDRRDRARRRRLPRDGRAAQRDGDAGGDAVGGGGARYTARYHSSLSTRTDSVTLWPSRRTSRITWRSTIEHSAWAAIPGGMSLGATPRSWSRR